MVALANWPLSCKQPHFLQLTEEESHEVLFSDQSEGQILSKFLRLGDSDDVTQKISDDVSSLLRRFKIM